MSRQSNWDKYEVALLIESVMKIHQGIVSRDDELHKLSNLLRKRAQNLGQIIDDKFRNYNGMSLQVASIESLLLPDRAPRHYSRLFDEMVALYNSDSMRFEAILTEAHRQSE